MWSLGGQPGSLLFFLRVISESGPVQLLSVLVQALNLWVNLLILKMGFTCGRSGMVSFFLAVGVQSYKVLLS